MLPYLPRRIRFHGVRVREGWQLKLYSISFDDTVPDWLTFATAVVLAEGELPRPAFTPARLGGGFAIAHHGRTGDYFVLAWWDLENEMPLRVFVRSNDEPARWRPASGSESVCVWDLEVIAFERDAYVATVLSSGTLATYLQRHAGVAASAPNDL